MIVVFIAPIQAQSTAGASLDSSNMLLECRALSTDPQDINNCMDNFLDLLDSSLADIEDFILGELGGSVGNNVAQVQAFERSQAAFRDFRRENCLWYLEFSEGRIEAEQIAKNCLAEMSQARLAELQGLVTDTPTEEKVEGFYVFGSDRNSFQFCGNTRRYWVEGDTVILSQLQQTYLAQALTDLAVLYVEVQGAVDEAAGSPYPGHDGVFRIRDLKLMRQPSDSDCQLPSQTPRVAANLPAAETAIEEPLSALPVEEPSSQPLTNPLEPEQQLTAYFGAWLAQCKQLGDSYGCVLSVEMDGEPVPGASQPVLKLTRRSEKRTIVDLEFPTLEIENIDQIRWSIDEFDVGPIAQSRIRVDAEAARQQIRNRKFIQQDLLPMLVGGSAVVIELESEGVIRNYVGTLIGLTRALTFADSFTAANGRI